MNVSPKGLALIQRFESCRLEAYPDPGTGGAPFTVGWGTTVYPDGTRVQPGDRITQEQADAFLAHDVGRFERAVSASVSVPITQSQFDALCSLAYNIGEGAFRNSTLLRKLNAGEPAADEFPRWNKSGGRVLAGLVNRRAAERALFLEEPMPIPFAIAAALLPSLIDKAPDLIKIFTDKDKPVGERNTEAAIKVLEIAKTATNAPNEQAAVEAIARDPEAAQAFRDGVKAQWFDLYDPEAFQAGEKSRGEARSYSERMMSGPAWRAAGFGVGLFGLALITLLGGGWMLRDILLTAETDATTKGMIIGAVITWVGGVLAFFFGSSASSRGKDQALSDAARKA